MQLLTRTAHTAASWIPRSLPCTCNAVRTLSLSSNRAQEKSYDTTRREGYYKRIERSGSSTSSTRPARNDSATREIPKLKARHPNARNGTGASRPSYQSAYPHRRSPRQTNNIRQPPQLREEDMDPKAPPPLSELPHDVLSALRLDIMNQSGSVPDEEALSSHLPVFLASRRRQRATDEKLAKKKQKVRERERERLDIAWTWQRLENERQGIERTEDQLKEDARVERRAIKREAARKEAMKQAEKEHTAILAANPGPNDPPAWLKHRAALKDKFPDGWAPPKRLSREAIELLRILHKSSPTTYTTPVLAERFKTSPEAVRRILKSAFELPLEEQERREAKRKLAREAERQMQDAEAADRGESGFTSRTWAGDKAAERDEMARLRSRRLE